MGRGDLVSFLKKQAINNDIAEISLPVVSMFWPHTSAELVLWDRIYSCMAIENRNHLPYV